MPERLLAFSFLESSPADSTHSDGILTRPCNVGGTVGLSLKQCSFGSFHVSQGADVPLSDLWPFLFGITHCLLGLLQLCDLAQGGLGIKGQAA